MVHLGACVAWAASKAERRCWSALARRRWLYRLVAGPHAPPLPADDEGLALALGGRQGNVEEREAVSAGAAAGIAAAFGESTVQGARLRAGGGGGGRRRCTSRACPPPPVPVVTRAAVEWGTLPRCSQAPPSAASSLPWRRRAASGTGASRGAALWPAPPPCLRTPSSTHGRWQVGCRAAAAPPGVCVAVARPSDLLVGPCVAAWSPPGMPAYLP